MTGYIAGRLAVAAICVTVLAGCERNSEETADAQGPAERVGAQVDLALSRAGEELNEVARKTGQNLQEFGRRLQSEARQAQGEESGTAEQNSGE